MTISQVEIQKEKKHGYGLTFFSIDSQKDLFDFRNLLGEDLGPLTIKELEQLERQLDVSLLQIRSTRVTNRHYFLIFN